MRWFTGAIVVNAVELVVVGLHVTGLVAVGATG